MTKGGLYKHNIKIHDMNNKMDCKYECKFCKKIFNSRQNKWSHEKICKIKDNSILSEQVKILADEITQLKNKSNIINNNSNNTINNTINNIVINHSPGTEPINQLENKKKLWIKD
jgi:hypothetical protein